jgi:VIT1/CCC1 family predicted Fe2+/Mn2+ transporter
MSLLEEQVHMGVACTIIFNSQDLQKKKHTERKEQGYLIYAKPEETYLRNVYPLFTIVNYSIGSFPPLSLYFFQNLHMKFTLPLFLSNLAVINYSLPLHISIFVFSLYSMAK